MKLSKSATGYAVITVVGLGLAAAVFGEAGHERENAKQHYIEAAKGEAREITHDVEDALQTIYENLRTLTFLPSISAIDRHGTNLGPDGRETIQQIYNNLASQVSVSEVYILPANFDPERRDPITGKAEEPILMFDELIIHGGRFAEELDPFAATKEANVSGPAADEIEIFEYRQFQEHLAWLAQHYPERTSITGLQSPMISGSEVITCDNTQYLATGDDADRSGVLFSVPFFGANDKLKGAVSGIILSNALRNLLPAENYALVNVQHYYRTRPSQHGQERASADWVSRGLPDPKLIYSEVIPLAVNDPRSKWAVWVGHPDQHFLESAEAQSIRYVETAGYTVVGLLTLAGFLCWAMFQRSLRLVHSANTSLEGKVAERTAEIQHMATHDVLTGLPNRTMLRERMQQALSRVSRGERIAVLWLDLDHFKQVNDTLGHPVGDALLKAVTERLKADLRESDMIARVGGDEFVIVQGMLQSPNQAAAFAERIIETIAQPFDVDGHTIVVGATLGIAVAPTDGEDSEKLLRNADIALYRAKSEGRGTCRFFEAGMDAALMARRKLQLDLREALAGNEFFLVYQPLVDAQSEALKGFEALLRWRHPKRGILLPQEFVPMAEETGLITPIGEWVLRRACEDAANWPVELKVAVNLSPAQFKSFKLAAAVVSALDISGLLPSRLELEITESVLLAENENTLNTLHQLRGLGVRIALDDFGTGYSSLSYLRSFPFDKIKIDRSFIKELTETDDCSAIVKAIAGLGSSLGIVTTAEGVETLQQLGKVREHGCVEAQGYYFSEPLPKADIDKMIRIRCGAAA